MPKSKTKNRVRKPLKTLGGAISTQSKKLIKEEGLNKSKIDKAKQQEKEEEKRTKRKRKEILKEIYNTIDKALSGGQIGGRLKIL